MPYLQKRGNAQLQDEERISTIAVQTATTGSLEDAQGLILTPARFTAEHNAPVPNLFTKYTLPKGKKAIETFKVGQVSFDRLTDGVPISSTADIGLTTVELTTSEVGCRFILTDKMVRQMNESAFAIIGRQMGDGLARIKNTDGIALFASFNGGTALGADNINLEIINLAACIAHARANKYVSPVHIVHHPNAVYMCMTSMAIMPETAGDPLAGSDPERAALLKSFYKMRFDNVEVYQTGDIAAVSGQDSGYGAIFSEQAAAYVESVGFQKRQQEDIDLRAMKTVVVADYGFFEIDDSQGAPMLYEVGAPATNN